MFRYARDAAESRAATQASRRRFETATVGAVAAVEDAFGFLWGHGFSGGLSPDQEAWARRWAACRKRIFDVGNEQARGLLSDITGK